MSIEDDIINEVSNLKEKDFVYRQITRKEKVSEDHYRLHLSCGHTMLMRKDLPHGHYGKYMQGSVVKACMHCTLKNKKDKEKP